MNYLEVFTSYVLFTLDKNLLHSCPSEHTLFRLDTGGRRYPALNVSCFFAHFLLRIASPVSPESHFYQLCTNTNATVNLFSDSH
jgi:hypothetical protein